MADPFKEALDRFRSGALLNPETRVTDRSIEDLIRFSGTPEETAARASVAARVFRTVVRVRVAELEAVEASQEPPCTCPAGSWSGECYRHGSLR